MTFYNKTPETELKKEKKKKKHHSGKETATNPFCIAPRRR